MSRPEQLALYAAEDAALTGRGILFSGLAEAQRYADRLVASDWWGERWPQVDRVAVGRSRSRRWDGYTVLAPGVPEIRLSSLRQRVLLHELAHAVTPGAGHGPPFVAAYLALVRREMGFHAYGALLHELGSQAGPFPTTGGPTVPERDKSTHLV